MWFSLIIFLIGGREQIFSVVLAIDIFLIVTLKFMGIVGS